MAGWSGELKPLLRLAIPLVLGELGWMTMGIVDAMMLGRVSPEAMSAASVSGILFMAVTVFGMGVLYGLDTLVSQAYGAGAIEDTQLSLVAGLWLAVPLCATLMTVQLAAVPFLVWLDVHPRVLELAAPFMETLAWSTPPLLAYSAMRRYLQGIGLVRPVMFALVSANVVNVVGDWTLIFGHFGLPAMGSQGAAWATVISRVYLAAVLAWAAFPLRVGFGIDFARIRSILAIGLPASVQVVMEVGVFALVTAFIARLEPVYGAAHQIALSAASYSFMIPLGLSSAAAVRVGNLVGARELHRAVRAGWTAIAMGVGFMMAAGLAFIVIPQWIARGFTSDAAVIRAAGPMLAWAALFQLFDGAQGVAVGALRGAGETRITAVAHTLGYWAVGLPLGYWLCFSAAWGAQGLWAGLSFALILIGLVLTIAWHRITRSWGRLHGEQRL
jgi:MATE family multidrug resistance protein